MKSRGQIVWQQSKVMSNEQGQGVQRQSVLLTFKCRSDKYGLSCKQYFSAQQSKKCSKKNCNFSVFFHRNTIQLQKLVHFLNTNSTLKSQMIQISYMYQQLYLPCTIFQRFSTLQFCSVMQCCKQKKSHPTPLEI